MNKFYVCKDNKYLVGVGKHITPKWGDITKAIGFEKLSYASDWAAYYDASIEITRHGKMFGVHLVEKI